MTRLQQWLNTCLLVLAWMMQRFRLHSCFACSFVFDLTYTLPFHFLANTKSYKKQVSRASLSHWRPFLWLLCCVMGLLILLISHFAQDHGSRLPSCSVLYNEPYLLLFSGMSLVIFLFVLLPLMQSLHNRSKIF